MEIASNILLLQRFRDGFCAGTPGIVRHASSYFSRRHPRPEVTYSTLPIHKRGTPEFTPSMAAACLGRRETPERSGVKVIELAATPGQTAAVHLFPHEAVAKPVADVVKPTAGAGKGLPPPPPPPPMPEKTDVGIAPLRLPPMSAFKISPPSRDIKDGVFPFSFFFFDNGAV
jgi:hypothetical protein